MVPSVPARGMAGRISAACSQLCEWGSGGLLEVPCRERSRPMIRSKMVGWNMHASTIQGRCMQAYPPRCTCMYICVHAYVDMGAIYVLIYRCRNNTRVMHTSICARTSGGAFASPTLPPPKRCPVCLQLKLHYDCHIEAGSLLMSATPGCVAFAGPGKGRFMQESLPVVSIVCRCISHRFIFSVLFM